MRACARARRTRPRARRRPCRERLTGLALVVEATHDAHDRLGCTLRRHLHRLVAEFHLRLAEVTAEQHLVARSSSTVRTPLEPEEPDVAHVVLSATVGAARDVDAYTGDLGQALVLECVADRVGKPARLCDREVARVRAG